MITSQLQTGAFTYPESSSYPLIQNVTITSIDTSRAMIQFTIRSANDARPNKWLFKAEFTTATNLRFTRDTQGYCGGLTVEWVVTEFDSGVANIQSGNVNVSANPQSVTLGSSVNLLKSFPITNVKTSALNLGNIKHEAKLTTSTNLQFAFAIGPSTGQADIVWQVVEFPTGCNVQSGQTVYAHNTGGTTQAITTVDTSKTLLNNFHQGGAGSNTLSRTSVRSYFSTASQITFANTETAGTANNLYNSWYVIEFTDGTSVQSGQDTVAAATATTNKTISSFVVARSQAWNTNNYQNFKTADIINEGNCIHTMKLTTATNFQLQRTNTATAVDLSWFVVQWEDEAPPVEGTIIPIIQYHRRMLVG